MAVENVNSKPIAASAEIADFILASIGGKLRRVPIRTLAETLTDAEVELISAAASALVSAAGRASYIGDNGNWYVWDGTKGMFVDSGKSSRGQQGVPGATPNLQIGTVETLPAGSDATASMGGTVENPLLNLGIPKGADGSGSGVAGD